jgi:GPH family glycoside/pentoside/hexuronide:cation symporter
MKEVKKFGVKDQVGYVMGDMAGSFVNLYVDAFFLTFCTYVLGINATWMGSLFLFARLWDAINDPLIGSLPDRFQIGKSGNKFKPYIKIAMLPLALSGLLCFLDVSSWGSVAKHAWVIFAYVFYGMSYTGTSMPFGSMAAVITNDPVERTKLSRARSIGGTLVGIGGLSLVPQFIFDKQGNVVPSAFGKIAIVFGIFSFLCYIGLIKFTEERVKQPAQANQKFNYVKVLKSVAKNRPLIGVMIATVGSLLYITGNSQLGSYIYKEYYHAPQVLTLTSIVMIPLMIICFPLVPKLTAKFGKRNVILVASGYNLVLSTILFLVPIPNVYAFLALNILATSGQTAFTMLIWALVTDCIDYHEYLTGERSDGSLYSIYTFSRKIGSTIASTLAAFSLGAIGYISGIESQTVAVANNIRYLCTAIPVLTCILELIGIGLIYNLTKEKSEEVYSKLEEMRSKSA